MRCIDHPTMVKDGSGWGAMAGVSAGLLAGGGFTGGPAATVEGPEVAAIWADLGGTWLTAQQDFKPYAICYWAQPAIAGALALQRAHRLPLERIRRITVSAFHEANRLGTWRPSSTEEAQYSLPFPLAAALVHGQLGVRELTGDALRDRQVLDLAGRVELLDDPDYSRRFPLERIARVRIETDAGEQFDAGEATALWDEATSAPPTDDELKAKYRWLGGECLPAARVSAIEAVAWRCDGLPVGHALALLSPLSYRFVSIVPPAPGSGDWPTVSPVNCTWHTWGCMMGAMKRRRALAVTLLALALALAARVLLAVGILRATGGTVYSVVDINARLASNPSGWDER